MTVVGTGDCDYLFSLNPPPGSSGSGSEGLDFCFVIPKRCFFDEDGTGAPRHPRAIIDGNHFISDREGRGRVRLITRKTDALLRGSPVI